MLAEIKKKKTSDTRKEIKVEEKREDLSRESQGRG